MDYDTIALRLDSVVNDLARVTDGLEKAIKTSYKNILVSCGEAARHLGVSPNTITRMLREGRLRKVTIGESTGIRFSEIMDMRPQ